MTRLRHHLFRIIGAVLLCAVIGCGGGATGNNARNPGGDPLIGNQPPLDQKSRAAGGDRNPSPSTTSTGAGPLPALPAPSSSTSTAALAPGAVPQLDRSRDLRIGQNSATGSPGGATLGKPEPVRSTPTSTPSGTAGAIAPLSFSAAPAGIASVDQGLQFLTNRGVQGFRLELQRDTGQWHCSCSLPNPQNPSVKRTYDYTANDPLAAIRAVVERVARDNP